MELAHDHGLREIMTLLTASVYPLLESGFARKPVVAHARSAVAQLCPP